VLGGNLLLQLLLLGLLFFLELHGAHAPESLFALDALLFTGLKYLLVLNTEFTALHVESVERSYNGIGILRKTEIGEGKTTERA